MAHVSADLITSYTKYGSPTDCGPEWTKEHIESGILKGPHTSAHVPAARQALLKEKDEKVKNGYAKVMRYGDIMHALPSKLKFSSVATIPHKSRSFRTILDLSFQLRHCGKLAESINLETVKMAPAESMIKLRNCVQRLIALLAESYDPKNPFMLSKLDIKDGFWSMAVSNYDAWNFGYVLFQANFNATLEDILIVMPNCLKMGCCESPTFFFAETKTAQNIIEALLLEASLPENLFEEKMLNMSATLQIQAMIHFSNLVEVFVGYFIVPTNNISKEHLEHLSRVMLFGVHSIFPPGVV